MTMKSETHGVTQKERKAFWVGVVSREHVQHGIDGGFAQVCNGRHGPLKRMRAGDGLAYYSPVLYFRGKEQFQCFTAIGAIRTGETYTVGMGGGFLPHRRNVEWVKAQDAPIRPLLDLLDFTAGRQNWGYQLRSGLFEISEHDFRLIAQAMKANISGAFGPSNGGPIPLNLQSPDQLNLF